MTEVFLILYIVRVVVDLYYFVNSICPLQACFLQNVIEKYFLFGVLRKFGVPCRMYSAADFDSLSRRRRMCPLTDYQI